ncbi:MAG TPA: lamin tail domain-containing protein [Polyangiaceae bacterium]
MLRPLLLLSALLLGACSGSPIPGDAGGYDDNSGFSQPLPDPLEASTTEDDSGVLSIGDRASDGGADRDAGSTPIDGGPPTNCQGPLASGDVKIVELMIESTSGSGDKGEWIELENTRTCIVNLNGLVVQSPRGTSTDTAKVTSDVFVQPSASFIVADSTDASDNHQLPGAAVVASFATYDVLKNSGDTVEVYVGATLIDALTYPQLALTPGRSVSFPSNCAWTDRASWSRWSGSFNVWSTPFQGTPGADNSDVTCY